MTTSLYFDNFMEASERDPIAERFKYFTKNFKETTHTAEELTPA